MPRGEAEVLDREAQANSTEPAHSPRNASQAAKEMVGETRLELATRSTQSYARTDDKGSEANDLGRAGASASHTLPTEGSKTPSSSPPVGDLLDALKGLGPDALRQFADALDKEQRGGRAHG